MQRGAAGCGQHVSARRGAPLYTVPRRAEALSDTRKFWGPRLPSVCFPRPVASLPSGREACRRPGHLASSQGGLELSGTDRRILDVQPGFSTSHTLTSGFPDASVCPREARNVDLDRRAWSGASLGWRRSTGSRRATPIYRTVTKLGSRQAHSARFIGPTVGTFIRPIPSISRTRQTNHRKGRRDTHPAAPSFPHCPV